VDCSCCLYGLPTGAVVIFESPHANLNGAVVATRTITFTVVNTSGPTALTAVAAHQPAPVAAPVPAAGQPWVETFTGSANGAPSDYICGAGLGPMAYESDWIQAHS
jgi:hypothetical protein